MDYNSYVLGIHNYYRIATHVNSDFREIGFSVKQTMKARLGQRLKKSGNTLPQYAVKWYGKSKQMRYIRGLPVLPIAYVQTRPPLHRARNGCIYTPQGREKIHKNLAKVDILMLRYVMQHPIINEIIEYNDNRLALFCAQQGKCAVTGRILVIGEIDCHHKHRKVDGGTDVYSNLTIVSQDVHRLLHATQECTIQKYSTLLKLNKGQLDKLNRLRKKTGNEPI